MNQCHYSNFRSATVQTVSYSRAVRVVAILTTHQQFMADLSEICSSYDNHSWWIHDYMGPLLNQLFGYKSSEYILCLELCIWGIVVQLITIR